MMCRAGVRLVLSLPRRLLALLATGAAGLSLWAGSADDLAAQQIHGTVVESVGQQPVPDVLISFLDGSDRFLLQVLTDSSGRFASALPRAGSYSLRIEKFGYLALHTEPFPLALEEILDLAIVIGVEAVPLTPVQVAARRREAPGAHPEFHWRVERGRQMGNGRFFTREDIEQTAFVKTSSMLMQVPGIRLVYARDGRVLLGGSGRGGYNCRPAVYLNGMEISAATDLDQLSLDELEGVEVYRWPTEMPVELARPGVCSAVAFWSRVGDQDGPPFSARRLLVGGALLTSLLLVGFLR
jgi:hypothetical protein